MHFNPAGAKTGKTVDTIIGLVINTKHNNVGNLRKVSNKDTLTSFWCLYCHGGWGTTKI